MRSVLFAATMTLTNAQSTLVLTAQTQRGWFEVGHDVGPMNPHAYRRNEFVTNDFVFEGLVTYDPDTPGIDGTAGTLDDQVQPSLAASWTTNEAAHLANPSIDFAITFNLRTGVTFHDGQPWDATAAAINFDHIMGGPSRQLVGFHDWYGLPSAIKSWEAMSTYEFKVTFNYYYEPALRELTFIRPFRFSSPLALPNISQAEESSGLYPLSCSAVFSNAPRQFPRTGSIYVCRGVKEPVGTGPYKAISKTMSSGVVIPAAEWNSTCWYINAFRGPSVCEYDNLGSPAPTVSEVLFEKFASSRLVDLTYPSYDRLIMKAYSSQKAVKDALLAGTLHLSYGVNSNPPSQFIRLATDQGNIVSAHEDTALLNTRTVVLNSAGQLNTTSLRQMVMGILSPAATQPLEEGELAEEVPQGTMFPLSRPYCNVTLTTIAAVAAGTMHCPTQASSCPGTGSLLPSSVGSISNPLRFAYIKTIPHNSVIASEVISTLYTHGINVLSLPLEKDDYNALMNTWTGSDGAASQANGADCGYATPGNPAAANRLEPYDASTGTGCISWDIALGETWGPPYDATSKLTDMTYEWGSGEADNVATSNLESISKYDFNQLILGLSRIEDPNQRQGNYSTVLSILQDSAVFLPLTSKQNLAVVNNNVGGFKFGSLEFDIPVAGLYDKTLIPQLAAAQQSSSDDLSDGAVAGIVVAAVAAALLLGIVLMLIAKEKQGTPIFTPMNDGPANKGSGVTMTNTKDAPAPVAVSCA